VMTVNNQQEAVLTTQALGTGTHTVQAVYADPGNNYAGASATVTQTVMQGQSVSVAFGPAGEVREVVTSAGELTQLDASGAHPLTSNVRTASVAFAPFGEVLLITTMDGALIQADATGTRLLAPSGVLSASVAFGPAGEVVLAVTPDGSLTRYDAT